MLQQNNSAPKPMPIQGDVTKGTDLARLGKFSPLEEISADRFDEIFSVNVKGSLFTVRKALPPMVNGGSFILNASRSASKSRGMSIVRLRLQFDRLPESGLPISVPGGAYTPGLRAAAQTGRCVLMWT